MKDNANSVKYNNDLDKQLKKTKVLTKDLFEQFYDAYSYDTATTYNWLIKKLKILKERLMNGESLQIENTKNLLNKENFLDWIESEFPNTKKDLI